MAAEGLSDRPDGDETNLAGVQLATPIGSDLDGAVKSRRQPFEAFVCLLGVRGSVCVAHGEWSALGRAQGRMRDSKCGLGLEPIQRVGKAAQVRQANRYGLAERRLEGVKIILGNGKAQLFVLFVPDGQ